MLKAGATFEAHLTPAAIEALQLEPEKQVWLVIKTYSCNLVAPAGR
jgi:ABC-type molybdate transport system ATPase subunit